MPDTRDPDPRTDQIVRAVLQILEEQRALAGGKRFTVGSLFASLRDNWALVAGAVSLAVVLIGWWQYGSSPFDAMENARSKREVIKHHVGLGNAFLNVGQVAAARVEFQAAKALDPANAAAQLGLLKSDVFEPISAGEYDPEIANRRIKAILDRAGEDTHALAFLGDVYSKVNPSVARAHYRRAIATEDTNAWAYYGLGVLHDVARQRPEAIAMYEKAVQRSEWNQTFLNNLAYQYYLQGDYQHAVDHYVRLLNLDPRYVLSIVMLAQANLRLDQTRIAYDRLKEAVHLLNDPAVMKLERNAGGIWLFHVGNQTIELYTELEKRAYVQYSAAMVGYLLGRTSEAERHLAEIGDQAPAARDLTVADVVAISKERPAMRPLLTPYLRRLTGLLAER